MIRRFVGFIYIAMICYRKARRHLLRCLEPAAIKVVQTGADMLIALSTRQFIGLYHDRKDLATVSSQKLYLVLVELYWNVEY